MTRVSVPRPTTPSRRSRARPSSCSATTTSPSTPNAVSVMVEEAYRSNAAIVGPKVVDHDRPEVLLEVGLAVDHYGVPFSGIEPDEVDQEQHDGVRDVFFVSHAAMLVRADLFQELSGFDPARSPVPTTSTSAGAPGSPGARVIVAPAARVRHRQATVVEERPTHASDPGDLGAATRSRVRVLYKSYSAARADLGAADLVAAVGRRRRSRCSFTGRARAAAAVFAGWFRAFAHPGELRRARAETQSLRRIDDGDVRDLMIRGSARIRTFVTLRMHAGERFAGRVRAHAHAHGRGDAPARAGAGNHRASILGALIVFGSRSLFFGRVPAVGGFQEWPGVGGVVVDVHRTVAHHDDGLGACRRPRVRPDVGRCRLVLLGHSGLARSLVVTGALPLGTWGVYRLVRPMAGTALPPVAAAVAYGANPLARNAIAHGSLGPLVCFALAPFVVSALGRASAEGVDRRTRIHTGLAIVLLVAVMGAFWPPGILVALAVGIAYVLAWPFSNDRPVVLRALGLSVVSDPARRAAPRAVVGVARRRRSPRRAARCRAHRSRSPTRCASIPVRPARALRLGASSRRPRCRCSSRPARASCGPRAHGCSRSSRSLPRGCRRGSGPTARGSHPTACSSSPRSDSRSRPDSVSRPCSTIFGSSTSDGGRCSPSSPRRDSPFRCSASRPARSRAGSTCRRTIGRRRTRG